MVNKNGVISCNRVIFKYAFSKSCDSHYLEFLTRSKTLVLLTIKVQYWILFKKGQQSVGIGAANRKEFSDKNITFVPLMDANRKRIGTKYVLGLLQNHRQATDHRQSITDPPTGPPTDLLTTNDRPPTHRQVLHQPTDDWQPTTNSRTRVLLSHGLQTINPPAGPPTTHRTLTINSPTGPLLIH